MAIGVFKLTKRQRIFLSTIFLILNLVQVSTGVIMLSLSLYIYISVAPVLFSERAEISYVFAVVAISGLNNICCWLFGFKIKAKCLKQAYKKSTRSLIFAWSCVCFYIIFYLLILAKHTGKIYKHVIRAMGHSFYIGMSKYLKEEVWKVSIDRIQYDLQCCGSHSYKEWHEISWLGKYHLNRNNHLVKQYGENGSWLFPVTPWSCCKVSFTKQCFHDPLQQIMSQMIWDEEKSLTIESINTQGCLAKLKGPIKWSLTSFILLVVLNCIIQIIIFFIVRILYTSCRNAEILNDTDGVAPGWIFGRGDCGYNRGKTLGEIMNSNNTRRRKSLKQNEQEGEKLLLDNHEN